MYAEWKNIPLVGSRISLSPFISLGNQFALAFNVVGGASASEPVHAPVNPSATNANPSVFQFPIQSGCAAALLCVEEQYCTLEGVISKEPIAFTSQQLLRRVPLSVCDKNHVFIASHA